MIPAGRATEGCSLSTTAPSSESTDNTRDPTEELTTTNVLTQNIRSQPLTRVSLARRATATPLVFILFTDAEWPTPDTDVIVRHSAVPVKANTGAVLVTTTDCTPDSIDTRMESPWRLPRNTPLDSGKYEIVLGPDGAVPTAQTRVTFIEDASIE